MSKKEMLQNRKRKQRMVRSWASAGKGHACFVVGAGTSLNNLSDEQIEKIQESFTICVNRAYQIIKPDILLYQDCQFFFENKKYVKENPDNCIMLTRDITSIVELPHLYTFKLITGKFSKPNRLPYLQGSGNSGALAFQLAMHLGFNPIILLGMDCCYDEEGNTSFFGKNKFHTNRTLINCRLGLAYIKLCSKMVKIYSLSTNNFFKQSSFLKVMKKLKKVKKKFKLI